MARKKSRSGALFIIIVLILLGLIIYAYKDKFELFFKYNFNIGKDFITKKKEEIKNSNNIKKFFSEKKKLEQKEDQKIFNDKENLKAEKKEDNEKKLEEIDKLNEKFSEKNNTSTVKNIKENQEVKSLESKKLLSSKNEKSEENVKKIINKKIYFTKLNNDGSLLLFPVNRKIEYVNTPLTETLKKLMEGPNESEKKDNIITNIPPNTKLLGVTIKNQTAYVNLSKEFEYNYSGKDSMIAQIKQIVYTACEFENIKSVQFLIENKIQTYLGGEGVVINKPFTKKDFE